MLPRRASRLPSGCAALHKELGKGAEPAYSTILTARPSLLVKPLLDSARGRELLRAVGPRLAVLPGTSDVGGMTRNLKNILVSNFVQREPWADRAAYEAHARRRYGALADHKVKVFAAFAEAYPDSTGRFCFLGVKIVWSERVVLGAFFVHSESVIDRRAIDHDGA